MGTYEKLNARVVALSIDSPQQSENLIEKSNLTLTLLCDEDRTVVDLYKLRNPFEHDGIAYPATFIINPEGIICYRSIDGTSSRVDLKDELSFLELLQKAPSLKMQTRPKKSWIIPYPGDIWRISRNMMAKGSFADWKNFLSAPINYIKMGASKLRNRYKIT
jgi:alkyl hydroperoxide reductase subunit AhpC